MKETDWSFGRKLRFFPPRPKFSKEDFRQKFVLPASFSPPLSVVPSFHFGDEMTSDNTNSFSADGGEGGKKKGDNQGEEEIVALVKESAEKCKKCERNILSNIDAFNSKIFDDTEDKNNNGLVRGRRRRRRRGEAALQRARKYVQALKGMVQDLESVAEDVLINVETNFSSSRRRSTTTDGFDENNDCEEKIRNIVPRAKVCHEKSPKLISRSASEETTERRGRGNEKAGRVVAS